MKQKLLNSLRLRVCALVALVLCATGSAWGQSTYKLVTNNNQLSDGDVIIIASGTNATTTPTSIYAIGAANSANNRKVASVSVSDNKITTAVDNANETTSGANTQNTDLTYPLEITLVASSSNWNLKEVLKDGDMYLNGGYKNTQNKNQNHLKAGSSVITSSGTGYANGVWSISINETSHVATITNQNSFTIKYNSSNNPNIFASYSSGQNDVYIYKKAYTVTYASNGGTGTMTDSNSPYFKNATVTLLDNAFTAPANSIFNGWVVTDGSSNTVAVSNNQFTMPASNVTVTAQWQVAAGDYITPNPTSITDISCNGDIAEFDLTTNIESPTYSVAYYTTSAGDETTTKPSWFGDVEFSGNTLDIAVNANTTASARTAYLKVYSGTTYSSVITITQDAFTVNPPSFNPVSGTTFTSDDVVELSCTTPNATIYYTMGNNPADPTNASTEYDPNEGVEVTASTTIKAIAYVGEVASAVAMATYTVVTPLANIAALTAETTADNYYVTLSNALVTYVSGNNAYLEDASGAVYLFGCKGDLAVGDKITGTANVTYTVYNGLPEVTAITLADGYTKTTGNTVTPTEVTIATLLDNNTDYSSWLSRYVVIKNATVTSAFSSKNCTIEQSGSSITLRDQNSTATLTSTVDDVVNVTGNVAIYNSTKQIAVWAQSQIVVAKVDPTITFNNGSVRVGQTLDLSTLFSSNSNGAVTYTITAGGSYATIEGSTLTGTAEGSVTVKAAQAESSSYNAGEATATITVNPALVLSSIAVTTAPTKTTYEEGETFDPTGMVVTATYSDNNTEAVTGYTYLPNGALATSDTEITISYTENGVTKTTTQAITVNEVVDYATLPFSWTGGGKSSLTALTGVTGNSLSNDYSAGYAPYLVKLDGTGDYIQIKTNEQPSKVYIGVKMAGGATTSTINVKASADGNDFDEGEALTISGSKDDILHLVSTRSFDSSVRYIRLYFTKGSNVGVGPISIIAGSSVAASVNAISGYGTFASGFPLDFSSVSNVSAWQITDISGTTITFSQITGTVASGTGVLLKREDTGDINIPVAASNAEITDYSSTNKLEGLTGYKTVTANTYYGLSGNEFVKVNAGTVPAGKALLPASTLTSNVKSFTFRFEDSTTGITTIDNGQLDNDQIFNLAGQRISNGQLKRGLYIRNGKKVVVK